MEIPQWLTWAVSVIVTVLGLFGFAKLVEMAKARRYVLQDRRQEITDANQGKLIDADQEALRIILGRLESVEAEQKKLTEAHNTLMLENERLKADAKHAEKEMVRQAEEIQNLRRRNHDLSNDIQSRDARILELAAKHDREVAELRGRIAQLEGMLTHYQTTTK